MPEDMWGSLTAGDGGGGGGGADPGGGTPPVTSGGDPSAIQLTQLLPANPSKGWGTSYYPVYTDQGDIGAVIPGTLTTQRVRLVDPSTGQTLAEGVGNDGAQQIATLANAVGQQLKGKAAYNIQVEMQPDQFTTVGGDDINHPHANFLKTLVQVAGPLLGAAIPGLSPLLGAALGGFGSTLATGGDFKSALLSAITSAAGNSLGGAAGGLFSGGPISFAGTNALGGLLGHLGDALSGAGSVAGSLGGAGGGAGLSALTNGAGGALGALGNTVAPVFVNGVASSGLSTALSSVLGGLGGLGGSILSGGGGGTSGVTGTSPGQGATELSPVTVTAAGPGGGVPLPGIPGLGGGGAGPGSAGVSGPVGPSDGSSSGETPEQHPTGGFGSDFFSQHNLLDLLGQTVGNTGADLGVYGLAQLLGLFDGGGVDGSNLTAGGGFDGAPDPTAPGQSPAPGATPGATLPGATFGPGPAGPGQSGGGAGGSGGALGQALGFANMGGGGGAVAPLAASPSLNVRGSTAPDIYPWRGHEFADAQGA